MEGLPYYICCVCINKNLQYVKTKRVLRGLQFWKAANGKANRVLNGHSARLASAAFSCEGTSCKASTLECSDGGDGVGSHSHRVWFVAFSPDGTHVVSGSGTSNKMTSPLGNHFHYSILNLLNYLWLESVYWIQIRAPWTFLLNHSFSATCRTEAISDSRV